MGQHLKQIFGELDLRVSQAEGWLRQLDGELLQAAKCKATLQQQLQHQQQEYVAVQTKLQLELEAVADLQNQLDDLQCLDKGHAAQALDSEGLSSGLKV